MVANKIDLDPDPEIPRESLEATVTFDWENGYVEASAKDQFNINKIFWVLLQQAKGLNNFSTSSRALAAAGDLASALRRHQSFPAVPARLFDDEFKQQVWSLASLLFSLL